MEAGARPASVIYICEGAGTQETAGREGCTFVTHKGLAAVRSSVPD
jgi:hypothetical protein